MKSLIIMPVVALISLSLRPFDHFYINNRLAIHDTIINHVLDGHTSEWPAEKFAQDKETGTRYSIDNDAENLYVAMVIPNFVTQTKMMRQGMKLYIDLKGKKKKGSGIEFPIKKERGGFNEGQQADIVQVRNMMALNLLSLRLFGFTEENEPKEQGLTVPGSVNIQFSWDDANLMYVEYNIPFHLLGDNNSLKEKNINLGWSLNAVEMSSNTQSTATTTTVTLQGRPSGTRPPGNGPTQQDTDNTKERSFWAKYTISIPAN